MHDIYSGTNILFSPDSLGITIDLVTAPETLSATLTSLTGTLNAYGAVGTFTVNAYGSLGPHAFEAALFGPAGHDFTIENAGLIITHGTGANATLAFDDGIVLASPGSILNTGSIIGNGGIELLGTAVSGHAGYISNAGLIEGTLAGAIGLQSAGEIKNTGKILSPDVGIYLVAGGSINNSGSIIASQKTFKVNGTLEPAIGIDLKAGGTITNNAGGTISGGGGIFAFNAHVANAGRIIGTYEFGADINGGTVTNTGLITGPEAGIIAPLAALTVSNTGTITATGTTVTTFGTLGYGTGVALEEGGAVTNGASGVISGGVIGLILEQGTSTAAISLNNAGTIIGSRFTGVELQGKGLLQNSGHITANIYGAVLSGGASLANTGSIVAGAYGVYAKSGDDPITNTGVISGKYEGVILSLGGTLTNGATAHASALISGPAYYGIFDGGASALITNNGSITGNNAILVYTTATGHTTLDNTGTLKARDSGIGLFETFGTSGTGLIENSGLIEASASIVTSGTVTYTPTDVQFETGATLINAATGTIIAAAIAAGDFAVAGTASINNAGLIEGAQGGIGSGNAQALHVQNSGTIAGGSGEGLQLNGNSYLSNSSTGLITGEQGAVGGNASAATVFNAGHITGGNGITFYPSGTGHATIDNTGAIVVQDSGITLNETFTAAGAGLVENTGLIEATASVATGSLGTFTPTDVALETGATLVNGATGTIIAAGFAVGDFAVAGTASINNAGLIEGAQGGIGSGNAEALRVQNAGTIKSTDGAGIQLNAGSYLSNASTGLISGGQYGIDGNAYAATIINAGHISGNNGINFYVPSATGHATIENSGTIAALYAGIDLYETFGTSGAGLIENTGLIEATASVATFGTITYPPANVQIETGAALVNGATGTISAAGFAVGDFNTPGTATLLNAGLITGAQGGVSTGAAAALNVQNSGTISGGGNQALQLSGASSLSNSGLITGGEGIYLSSTLTGHATIDNSGTIDVQDFGINFNETIGTAGTALITNTGLIEATASIQTAGTVSFPPANVQIETGATLVNGVTGTISAAGFAVGDFNTPGTATILNAGLITGAQGGVSTGAAAALNVQNSGTISGGTDTALQLSGTSSLSNSGLITGGDGIYFNSTLTGHATINNSGTIDVQDFGINFSETVGTAGIGLITNTGLIEATASIQTAGTVSFAPANVLLEAGTTLVNNATGTITTAGIGVGDHGPAGSAEVINAGLISGAQGGVNTGNDNLLTLQNSGTIESAAAAGVQFNGSGYLSNAATGLISGVPGGVNTSDGDLLTLQNAGTIESSAQSAINLNGGGTVIDSGLLAGGDGRAAIYVGTGALHLILETGARLAGGVSAGTSAANELEFAQNSTGTLDMAGTITGFETIAFDTGSSWSLGGNVSALANGQTITGFAKGDTLILDGFTAAGDTFVSGTGLELTSGSSHITLDLKGSFTTGSFSVVEGSHGATIALASAATSAAAAFITSLAGATSDTITALASQQTLTGGPGIDTLIGYAGFGDSFLGTAAGLNAATLQYFGGSDLAGITGLARSVAGLGGIGAVPDGTLALSHGAITTFIPLSTSTDLAASLFNPNGHG